MSFLNGIVSEAYVAQILGVTVKTLRNQRAMGKGPPSIQAEVGRSAIYHIHDVDDYLYAARMAVAKEMTRHTGNDKSICPKGRPVCPKREARSWSSKGQLHAQSQRRGVR